MKLTTSYQLRRQYRCHPDIGSLASSLFYKGQLINGVTVEQRNSFVKGFAPIVFFDVSSGMESANESGSFVNNEVHKSFHFETFIILILKPPQEAKFVKSLVLGIIGAGVKATQVDKYLL